MYPNPKSSEVIQNFITRSRHAKLARAKKVKNTPKEIEDNLDNDDDEDEDEDENDNEETDTVKRAVSPQPPPPKPQPQQQDDISAPSSLSSVDKKLSELQMSPAMKTYKSLTQSTQNLPTTEGNNRQSSYSVNNNKTDTSSIQDENSRSSAAPTTPVTQNVTVKKPAVPATPVVPEVDPKPTVFKADRICRLSIQINCADFLGDTLLFGTDDGLYSYESKGKI